MFIPHSPRRSCIGILVEERYLGQAQPQGLVDRLRRRGTEVRVMVADHLPVELARVGWAADLDLVVARGRSATLLALLRALQAHGVPVLHDASGIAAVVDKAGMGAVMARAGIPVPRTWLAASTDLVEMDDLPFPLVLKPLHGDNARGIKVVTDRASLREVDWAEPVVLAQPFHRGDGQDLKLYVAGSTVWAVHRESPIDADGSRRPDPTPGVPVTVTHEMLWLASACAEAFGLTLFGIDCVEVDGALLVIEVNEYPNYRGLPGDADEMLCDVVLDAATLPARTSTARRRAQAVAG